MIVNNIVMTVGYQVMSWRRWANLSQSELSKKSGLTRAYISRIESDQVDPSVSTIRQIAQSLGIAVGPILDESPPIIELIGRRWISSLAQRSGRDKLQVRTRGGREFFRRSYESVGWPQVFCGSAVKTPKVLRRPLRD